MFVPALLALLPGHSRWLGDPRGRPAGAGPRRCAIHYFNLAGAYIVAPHAGSRAVFLHGLFLCRCESGRNEIRLCHCLARSLERLAGRARARRCRRSWKSARVTQAGIQTQIIPARALPRPGSRTARRKAYGNREIRGRGTSRPRSAREGIFADEVARATQIGRANWSEVTATRRQLTKAKTTMPRLAGRYKLPSSSLLHRADEQQR